MLIGIDDLAAAFAIPDEIPTDDAIFRDVQGTTLSIQNDNMLVVTNGLGFKGDIGHDIFSMKSMSSLYHVDTGLSIRKFHQKRNILTPREIGWENDNESRGFKKCPVSMRFFLDFDMPVTYSLLQARHNIGYWNLVNILHIVRAVKSLSNS